MCKICAGLCLCAVVSINIKRCRAKMCFFPYPPPVKLTQPHNLCKITRPIFLNPSFLYVEAPSSPLSMWMS